MQSLWLIILTFFLVLIIIPIPIKIKGSYNLAKNKGILGFKVLWFKFRIFDFKFKNFTIQVKGKNAKETQEIEIVPTRDEIIYIQRLLAQFRDKLKIKLLFFKSVVGVGDAFASAMIAGELDILFSALFAFVKNFKQTTSLTSVSKVDYNKKVFKAKIVLNLSISIFDFMYCLLFSLIMTKRRLKNEQKVQRRKLGGKTAWHQHWEN